MFNDHFIPQPTADGSCTFFSAEFDESFHSHYGARTEAIQKFVVPTRLIAVAKQPKVRLLDICYGLGYNTAAALEQIWTVNRNCLVEWVGLELDPTVPQKAIGHHLLDCWQSPIPELLAQLATTHMLQTDRLQAQLHVGDARQTIVPVYNSGFQADAIFLDPFSPPHCPQLWTVEFVNLLAKCLGPSGLLATYSSAAAVRKALLLAGLKIGSVPPVGRRSPSTIASITDRHLPHVSSTDGKTLISHPVENASNPHDCVREIPNYELRTTNYELTLPPLSPQEREHLLTRAAIPYRDPNLRDSAEVIIERRCREQKASGLEATTHWRKRWLKS
ncbi:MAG: tRNA (5-methylaminomethyl-2-thiouridine)(34)-methyltransferase MnmD [Hormoscilla sp.]